MNFIRLNIVPTFLLILGFCIGYLIGCPLKGFIVSLAIVSIFTIIGNLK